MGASSCSGVTVESDAFLSFGHSVLLLVEGAFPQVVLDVDPLFIGHGSSPSTTWAKAQAAVLQHQIIMVDLAFDRARVRRLTLRTEPFVGTVPWRRSSVCSMKGSA